MRKPNNDDFTLKNMHFIIAFNDNLDFYKQDSDFFVTEDQSLMYKDTRGDFSVLLGGNWRLELIIDSTTGQCIKYHSFLEGIDIFITSLKLPISRCGKLFFKSDSALEFASGCHYYPFIDKVCYDKAKSIMCIGDCYAEGETIEFAKNIFAVINSGQLKALFLKLNNICL